MTQKLNLEIIEPSNMGEVNRKRAVDITPFRVGRDAGNNWVIEDELKQISRTHFIIEYINNVFTIIDVSSNGVSLNSSQQPIGRGKSSVLSHGDIISLSGIKIRASIFEGASKDDADPFLNMLPEREQSKRVSVGADDIFSSIPSKPFGVSVQDRPDDQRLSNSLLPDFGVETPDRFLSSEEPDADFNFDRTPADLARFESAVPSGQGIPENWFDDEPAETVAAATRLDSESLHIENGHGLLKLLLSQLAVLEKAVSVDGDLLLSLEPEETLSRLSSMDDQTVAYLVKAIFSQAIVKLENSDLRQILSGKSQINTNAPGQDAV